MSDKKPNKTNEQQGSTAFTVTVTKTLYQNFKDSADKVGLSIQDAIKQLMVEFNEKQK